ncbi:hypothetical protein ACFL2Q_09240 [Thermodesulfobacteriota bacterium]
MEKLAYGILLIVTIGWLVLMVVGMVAAYPFGIVGLFVLAAFGLLFYKVLSERLTSKEDEYYSKTVER